MSKNIHRLYIVTAIIWGGILGALSFLVIGAGVSGIFWTLIFGDNAWPNWAWVIVYTLAGLAGAVVFSACVFIGWSYSQKISVIGSATKKEYHRVVFLLILSLFVIFGYVVHDNYQGKKNALLHQQRVEAEKKRKEDSSPYRKTGESDIAYYCRIIRKGSKIDLLYHGHRIKIVQDALLSNRLIFAISAPYDLVEEFASDIIITEEIIKGGRKLVTNFIALPSDVTCGNNVYFISSNENNLPSSLLYAEKVSGRLPSISVEFPFYVKWKRGRIYLIPSLNSTGKKKCRQFNKR